MPNRVILLFVCLIVLSPAADAASTSGAPAASSLAKIPASGTTIKKKLGYWVECSYSGLGENCYYVYARPRGAAPNLQKVKATDSRLVQRNGYWVECSYSGLGDNCYYVYSHPRMASPNK